MYLTVTYSLSMCSCDTHPLHFKNYSALPHLIGALMVKILLLLENGEPGVGSRLSGSVTFTFFYP